MSRTPPARSKLTPSQSAKAAVQIDLFPERPVIDVLSPSAVVGPRTAARSVIRVRMRSVEAPHLVFHDRHGWYCETHGPACEAVPVAQLSQHIPVDASATPTASPDTDTHTATDTESMTHHAPPRRKRSGQ